MDSHCSFGRRQNFYPRPPRGGRPPAPRRAHRRRYISIHALREEGDASDPAANGTPSNFYPRPPRGGRPADLPRRIYGVGISIHALREEGDS